MAARLHTLAALLALLPLGGVQARSDLGASLAICLLSPAADPPALGVVRAITPVATPTIFARGLFAEIRLEDRGKVLWSQQASGPQPVEGPLAWPLPPLRPGQTLLLRLRPLGVEENAFADVEVTGASAATLARTAALVHSLGSDPKAWQRAVVTELDAGRTAVALALLYDFHGPASEDLNTLRREVHDQACDSAILGRETPPR